MTEQRRTGDGRGGDCFEAAAEGVEIMSATIPGVMLVHGLPVGRGEHNAGKPFWHAWVEVVVAGEPVVYDYSNGLRVQMSRAEYYERGQIRQVFRYKPVQMRREMARHDTYGPWVKGWETMGL